MKRRDYNRTAFTLLETMLAVAVLVMVTLSIYRFVDTTLTGIRISSELEKEEGLDDAFERFFRAQIAALPARPQAIIGEPHLFSGVAMDEIRWYAVPGFGALTQFARGEQSVTLTVQDNKEQSAKGEGSLEIGLRRQDAAATQEARWYPLLKGVKGLEIRYYQSESQEWLDKWTEQFVRPARVRLRYWRGASPDPVEIVVAVPPVSSQVLAAQMMDGGNNNTLPTPQFRPRGQGQGGDSSQGGERGSRTPRGSRQSQSQSQSQGGEGGERPARGVRSGQPPNTRPPAGSPPAFRR